MPNQRLLLKISLAASFVNCGVAVQPCRAQDAAQYISGARSNYVVEPLNEKTLGAYARLLPKLKNEENLIHVAGYLHRYGKAEGTKVLAEQLIQHHSLNAAAVLASTQAAEFLPDILRVLEQLKPIAGLGLYDCGLIPALGSWHEPRVTEALLEYARTTPLTGNLALALASHKDPRALKYLRKPITDKNEASFGGEVDRRLALAYFENKPDQIRQFLPRVGKYSSVVPGGDTQNSVTRWQHTFKAIQYWRWREAAPVLRPYLPHLKRQMYASSTLPPLGGKPTLTLSDRTDFSRSMIATVAATGDMQSKADLVVLLTDYPLRKYISSKYQQFSKEAVAYPIFTMDPQDKDGTLKSALSEVWLQEQRTVANLKPVPSHLQFISRELAEAINRESR